MSRLTKIALAGALAGAATSATAGAASRSPEARLDKLLDGRVAGRPVACINLRDIQSSEIIDGTAIVYRVGKRLFVNRPRSGAYQLDSDDILMTRSVTSQLCRIDTVGLFDRTSRFQSGFVTLGEFVPYTRP